MRGWVASAGILSLIACGDDGSSASDAGPDGGSIAPPCADFGGTWVANLSLEATFGLDDPLSRTRLEITQSECSTSIYDDDLEATYSGTADQMGIDVDARDQPIDDGPRSGTVRIQAFRLEMGSERLTGSATFSIEGGDFDGCTGTASYTAELQASCGAYYCTDSSQCCELGDEFESCYLADYEGAQSVCRSHCGSDADCPEDRCRCADVSANLLGTPNASRMCERTDDCSTTADCCPDAVCVATTGASGYCLSTCNVDSDCGGSYCCRPIPWTIMGSSGSGRYCTDQCSGGGTGNACSECLSACRGLPSCCTGVGCICDSAC